VILYHLVNRPDVGALWMDTTGDFSAERLVQILSLHDGQVESVVVSLVMVLN
jgi:hypothetical protein